LGSRSVGVAGSSSGPQLVADPLGGEMTSARAERSFEVEFFRTLNRVVEPIVRVGFGSPRIAPTGLIVLETRGRKTGQRRRNPLAAARIGNHVIVATFRGDRSQWFRNLAAEPRTRFWLGGRSRDARAFVMHQGKRFRVPKSLPVPLQKVVRVLAPYTKVGWAFAVLSPPTGKVRRPTSECS
jgi:deazaflavin-dependent oxidoreductase (nitroreductase family)